MSSLDQSLRELITEAVREAFMSAHFRLAAQKDMPAEKDPLRQEPAETETEPEPAPKKRCRPAKAEAPAKKGRPAKFEGPVDDIEDLEDEPTISYEDFMVELKKLIADSELGVEEAKNAAKKCAMKTHKADKFKDIPAASLADALDALGEIL